MIEASCHASGLIAAQSLLNRAEASRDEETRLSATLRRAERFPDARATPPRDPSAAEAQQRRVAGEIHRELESRLPGRIQNLQVAVDDGQFVLTGSSSSYYVKQMAQHLAMTALDKRMLGRIVNEIQVRAPR